MFQRLRVAEPLSMTAVWVSLWMAGAHLFLGGDLVLDGPTWLALVWVGSVLLFGVSVTLWCAARLCTRWVGPDLTLPLVGGAAGLGWLAGPGDETSGARILVALVAAGLALGASRWNGGRPARGGVRAPWILMSVGALASIGWRVAPSDWGSWTIPGSPDAPNVLVIGVDGLDLDLFHQYHEEDRIPTLSALADRGAMGPMRTFQPTSSPFIWNSI